MTKASHRLALIIVISVWPSVSFGDADCMFLEVSASNTPHGSTDPRLSAIQEELKTSTFKGWNTFVLLTKLLPTIPSGGQVNANLRSGRLALKLDKDGKADQRIKLTIVGPGGKSVLDYSNDFRVMQWNFIVFIKDGPRGVFFAMKCNHR